MILATNIKHLFFITVPTIIFYIILSYNKGQQETKRTFLFYIRVNLLLFKRFKVLFLLKKVEGKRIKNPLLLTLNV